MADLTITAANVGVNSASSLVQIVQYGAAVTQGQPLYISSGKWYPADANDTSTKAQVAAISLTPGSTDEYGVVAMSGSDVDLGTTLTVSETYVLSRNIGKICPIADLTSADYLTILGTASTASNLVFEPRATGVQKP